MSTGTPPRQPAEESEWQRRRRLDEVFGDVLPDVTTDEQAEQSDSTDQATDSDEWLRAQVPPHHG